MLLNVLISAIVAISNAATDKIYVSGHLESSKTKGDAVMALIKSPESVVWECAGQTLSRKGTLKALPGDKLYFIGTTPKGTDKKIDALTQAAFGKEAFVCTRKVLNPHTGGLTNF